MAPQGRRRLETDRLREVQAANRTWWETTPMTYDWRGETKLDRNSDRWFDDQDARMHRTSSHFATRSIPFDRIIPYGDLRDQEVLEVGVGAGMHSELMARAGASVTGIDLTAAAIESTRTRFETRGLTGTFDRWDAEQPRTDFENRFSFVWSWGVIHHSAHTARIVRNVASWLKPEGRFAGMVYHRDATEPAIALLRDGLLKARLRSHSVDELLWRNTDGFSARFYPADQWRDLLLGFFEKATVRISGQMVDAVPLPRWLRSVVEPRLSSRLRDRILERFGSFLIFDAAVRLGR
jgi:2-polyprenyl-3-methyl-5-hydroxy-6-metoxy-1,4-benzoquinol methylase